MSVLDGVMGRLADTLTTTFGRSVALWSPGVDGAYDPATGQVTGSAAPTSTPVRIVYDDSRLDLFPETLIQGGERVGIVARVQAGFPVAGRDQIRDGAEVYEVVMVMPYSSGEQEAAFALLLRRT